MISGLVAYDDDSLSEADDAHHPSIPTKAPSESRPVDDQSSKSGANTISGSSSATKSHIIIRRLAHNKPRPRGRLEEDLEPQTQQPAEKMNQLVFSNPSGSSIQPTSADNPDETDENLSVKYLLRPPPIPGLDDWGIPPEPEGQCDPAIEEKLSQFQALKRDPSHPKHFNDSLMSNRSFRNPHLYAKLVEFVNVDERTVNFPREVWNPHDVEEQWFADSIADHQKMRSEKLGVSQMQAAGKRTRLEFTASSSRYPDRLVNHNIGLSKSHQLREGHLSGRNVGPSKWG